MKTNRSLVKKNVSCICFMFRLCIACQFILHNPQILQFEVSAANILKDYRQVQPVQPGLTPPRSQKNKRPGYVPEITHSVQLSLHWRTGEISL